MRVFVASTYLDNRARRQIVEQAILRAEMLPVGMERFGASPDPTVEDCLRRVRECDVLVCIVDSRYGWIPEGHQLSMTELEYDAAKAAGIPRLVFEIQGVGEDAPWIDHPAKLDAFRVKLRADQKPVACPDSQLGLVVLQSLGDLGKRGVDSSSASRLEQRQGIAEDLQRLRREACEELDFSANVLCNLPLTLSPSDAARREETFLRLRRIAARLSNLEDVPQTLRRDLDQLSIPDVASMHEAGRLIMRLANSTTLGHQPTIEDKLAEERENQIDLDKARVLLRCRGSRA